MRVDMEDLLEKAYSQKEKPTKEFYQSVIDKMREKEARSSFLGVNWLGNKVLAVAICTGILLLAGAMVRGWMTQNAPGHGPSLGQLAAEVQTSAPTATNSTKEIDDMFPGDDQLAKNDLQQGEKGVPGSRNRGVQENQPENLSGNSLGSDQGIPADTMGEMKNTFVSEPPHPGVTSPSYPVNKPSSEPELPLGTETEAPPSEDTSQIGAISPPEETLQPAGGYVSVCSIDVFSVEAPSNIDVDTIAGVGMFTNCLVSSYEQHQTLLKEARTKAAEDPSDIKLQSMIQRLERYEKSYFVSNVLCVNVFFLDQDYKLALSSVNIKENSSGSLELNVQLDKVLSGTATEGTKKKIYYSCFVHVPKTVVQSCNSVIFRL